VTSFFDTSVLFAAFIEDHEHHVPSLRAFSRSTRKTGCCAAHSLADLYAIATGLPRRQRLTRDQALMLLENVRERLTLVALDPQEYLDEIARAASVGVSGGTIYDALLIACAAKARASVIYTWNVGHFRQAWPTLGERIQAPP